MVTDILPTVNNVLCLTKIFSLIFIVKKLTNILLAFVIYFNFASK